MKHHRSSSSPNRWYEEEDSGECRYESRNDQEDGGQDNHRPVGEHFRGFVLVADDPADR